MSSLSSLEATWRDLVADLSPQLGVPGFVAAIWHDGQMIELAQGKANVATGAEMTTDTAFLFGSITKVMTATLAVQRALPLDAPMSKYLPGLPFEVTVGQLLNHTNGIDATTLLPPSANWPGATRVYVDALADSGVGLLFEPGECVSYSNAGFVLAAAILEEVSGTPFNSLLEREVYGPLGMNRSCTSAEQAILGRVAVGHVPDDSGGVAPVSTFMLSAAAAGAGATAIGTASDLVAFGRAHLDSADLETMQHVTADLHTPNCPPVGLGWFAPRFAGVRALTHGGGSPGGRAQLVVLPEHDVVYAGFGNGLTAGVIHDQIVRSILRDALGEVVSPPAPSSGAPFDPTPYLGSYQQFQVRTDITATNAGLRLEQRFQPYDDHHVEVFAGYTGRTIPDPALSIDLVPLGGDLFAPAGVPLEAFSCLGRESLVSFHRGTADEHFPYIHTGLRLARRLP